MRIYSNGQMLQVPSGCGGSNPIGTVISFMGTAAPAGYLVCDGAVYSVSQYPNLASFFQAQFGTKNHFGGDGTTTFAVPDLRNMFLRGYRGEAEEQLSGDIGQRQEATSNVMFGVDTRGGAKSLVAYSDSNVFEWTLNCDTIELASKGYWAGLTAEFGGTGEPKRYTSRPVNMAVLYCIKATPGGSGDSGGVTMDEVNAAIAAAITAANKD